MPKIFNDETISLVWEMLRVQNMRRSEVAKELCTTAEKIDAIYSAAYRRFGCNQHGNRARKTERMFIKKEPTTNINRHPAVYSNKQRNEFLSL